MSGKFQLILKFLCNCISQFKLKLKNVLDLFIIVASNNQIKLSIVDFFLYITFRYIFFNLVSLTFINAFFKIVFLHIPFAAKQTQTELGSSHNINTEFVFTTQSFKNEPFHLEFFVFRASGFRIFLPRTQKASQFLFFVTAVTGTTPGVLS